jgi:hypothetical protein
MDQQIRKNIGRWGGEAHLETEDFHLHHLNLQTLGLLNVHARGERRSSRIYLRRSALLIGKPSAVHSRSEKTVVHYVGNVDVLRFRVVLGLFIVRGKTGEAESSARGGGVGDVGGIGANTAGAKTSEEGSTVVLVRYGHSVRDRKVERSI